MEKIYKVLFVDDEINVINSLRRGLIQEPYECLFANSGREALEIMLEEEIAVIVSDMRMPQMTGLQLLIHVQELYPEVVCIILSGYTQLQQILTTINQVDVFKFITKPWKLEEEFKVAINKALDFYKIKEQNIIMKKSLENQNKAYQNILSRIDVSIQAAKRSTSVLGEVGNVIFDFNLRYFRSNTKYFEQLLLIESFAYKQLVNAVLYDAKSMNIHMALQLIRESIEMDVPFTFDNKNVELEEVELFLEIAIALLKSLIYTFKEQFRAYGLNIVEGNSNKGKATVSLMTKNFIGDYLEKQMALDNSIKPLEVIKLEFANQIIQTMCKYTNMVFGYVIKGERLIFVLTLNKL